MVKKTLAAALATTMALTLTTGTAQAFSDDELVIWVGGDKAYNGIREPVNSSKKKWASRSRLRFPRR